MTRITTKAQLRDIYAPPNGRSVRKDLDHLDRH